MEALRDKLGSDAIARPDQLARKLDLTIEAKESGFHARLALVDRDGKTLSRDVAAPTCAQATNAIVLIAALAARAQREDEPPPAPPARPETKPVPTPPASAPVPEENIAPVASSSSPEPIVPEIFLALGVASGVGPSLAPGVAVGGRLRFTSVGPSVGLSVGVHDSFRTDVDGIQARFRRVAVRGELCPYEPALSSTLELSPCLGFELGAHTGSAYVGERVERSRTESLLFSQATLALRLRIHAAPIVFDLGPEVGLVFTRNQFALAATPDQDVYRVPRVTAAGRAAIGLIF